MEYFKQLEAADYDSLPLEQQKIVEKINEAKSKWNNLDDVRNKRTEKDFDGYETVRTDFSDFGGSSSDDINSVMRKRDKKLLNKNPDLTEENIAANNKGWD